MTNDERRKHMMTALGELMTALGELVHASSHVADAACYGHLTMAHDHTLMAMTNLHQLCRLFPSVTSKFSDDFAIRDTHYQKPLDGNPNDRD